MENFKKIENKDLVAITTLMIVFIEENGKMIKDMVKVPIKSKVNNKLTKDNGSMELGKTCYSNYFFSISHFFFFCFFFKFLLGKEKEQ